jgi:hypothetical protein
MKRMTSEMCARLHQRPFRRRVRSVRTAPFPYGVRKDLRYTIRVLKYTKS